MKMALITGISKGIGRAIAARFLEEGYSVCGTYFRDKTKAEELVAQYGSKVELFGPFDFTNIEDINRFIDVAKTYKYDSLICSAGIFSENDDFNSFDLDAFLQTMNCNFYAPLLISVGLKDNINKGGSIVLM